MFAPGDEVVCVDAGANPFHLAGAWQGDAPTEGHIYTVRGWSDDGPYGDPCVFLVEITNNAFGHFDGYSAWRFRKVQKRNDGLSIEAFLTIKPGFEEPKRAPAKKRERAS